MIVELKDGELINKVTKIKNEPKNSGLNNKKHLHQKGEGYRIVDKNDIRKIWEKENLEL